MHRLQCPFLAAAVEITRERCDHIATRHPELIPRHAWLIAATLRRPEQVRRSRRRADALLFSRCYDALGGRHVVVVVVVSGEHPWVVTAYLTRTLTGGRIEWPRS